MLGIHDPPPLEWLNSRDIAIVFPRAVGIDPNNHHGEDFSAYGEVIVRFGVDWSGGGCIPEEKDYDNFAQRVANFVAASVGIDIVIIGNEPQHEVERPNEVPISPQNFALCFKKCYDKIKEVSDVRVGPGAIAPWYSDDEHPDWITYWVDMLETISILGTLDFLCVHAYTHGHSPDLITSLEEMETRPGMYYHFQHYRQLLSAVPEIFSTKDVYITETDQTDFWLNENTGWVQAAYDETRHWNHTNIQQIKRLCLYRWSNADEWEFGNKPGVLADLEQAMKEKTMRVAYQTSFEDGFEYYNLESALNCPVGWIPKWNDTHQRPEYSPKDADQGHPEVRTGRFAAGFYSRWSEMSACLTKSFSFAPGTNFRGTVWAMYVATAKGFGQALKAGSPGDWDAAMDSSPWWDNNSGAQDRVWKELVVEGTVDQTGILNIYLLAHTDNAMEGGHSHWDDFKLEVEDGSPPVTGDHKVSIAIDDVHIGDLRFAAEASGITFKAAQ